MCYLDPSGLLSYYPGSNLASLYQDFFPLRTYRSQPLSDATCCMMTFSEFNRNFEVPCDPVSFGLLEVFR